MDPHRLARSFVQLKASDSKGLCTLRHWQGEWWRWEQGRYRRISTDELRVELTQIIKRLVDEEWLVGRDQRAYQVTAARVNNVLNALKGLLNIDASVDPPVWLGDRQRTFLALENGLIDLDDLLSEKPVELIVGGSPLWFSPVRLPVQYNASAEAPIWQEFVSRVLEDDEKRISLLQEWFGYSLTFDTTFQKFLILEGEGANGKSVVTSTLTNLLGDENVSHVPLEAFKTNFQLSATIGKLANIVSEVSSVSQVNEGVLKEFTGGDRMSFDRKFLAPLQVRPTARLIVATNNRPRVSDATNGLWRRMMLMPFRVTIPEKERDPLLVDKLKAELPGILNWAIEGLKRLRRQMQFTASAVNDAALAEYREEANPVRLYLESCCSADAAESTPIQTLYADYKRWGEDFKHLPLLNEREFGKEVAKAFPNVERKRRQDERHRVYLYHGLKFEVAHVAQGSLPQD